jgi:hypothetical protein
MDQPWREEPKSYLERSPFKRHCGAVVCEVRFQARFMARLDGLRQEYRSESGGRKDVLQRVEGLLIREVGE